MPTPRMLIGTGCGFFGTALADFILVQSSLLPVPPSATLVHALRTPAIVGVGLYTLIIGIVLLSKEG